MKIGIIGRGFVGGAIESYFRQAGMTVFAHDKHVLGGVPLREVAQGDVIFVAVPTPMDKDGSCHTKIVEEVLFSLQRVVSAAGRAGKLVTVIKSTVPPGFTKRMREALPDLRIVFSPEFLTEKNAKKDFAEAGRIIVGGPPEDAFIVFEAHRLGRPAATAPALEVACDPTTVELSKLAVNAHLFARVLLANEIAMVAKGLSVDYDNVRHLASLDPRVGESHMNVPGHDGMRGAGGHCFPKDMESLRSIAHQLGTREVLFTAILARNRELREKLEWEEMKGRAVL
jgi:UDPglucose 6-dehydrogenase